MWIEELPNGKFKYVERYEDPLTGKTRKVSLTSTKKNNRVEKEMTKRLLKKIEQKKSRNVIEDITFNQLADEWLSLYQQRVKPSTYVTTKNSLNPIRREFGAYKLKKLAPAQFNQYLLNRYAEGTTAVTLNIYKSIINRLFKHAVLYGYLKDNPILNKLQLPASPKPKNKDFKFLERDQLRNLIQHFEDNEQYEYARFTLLMANLGTRFGELASIRFEDIDFEENKIDINHTFSRLTYEFQTPKTGTRQIYFHDDMKPVLKAQIKHAKMKLLRQGYDKNNTLLFRSDGEKPLVIETYNRALKEFNDEISSHWLRHTYISLMVEQGVNTRIIAEQVGHADTTMIDRVYSHFTQTMKQQQKEMQTQFKVL